MEDMFCLQKLPELSEKVFIFLDTSSVLECRSVCKAFNYVIENPHFWLKKLSFDGKENNLLKTVQALMSINKELSRHPNMEEKFFFKFVWLNEAENKFYGIWHQGLYMMADPKLDNLKDKTSNLVIDETVSYLKENLSNLLQKWRQVLTNQSKVNCASAKNSSLYLIKLSKLFSTLKHIPGVNEIMLKQLSSAMRKRKRGNWFHQAYFKNKMELPVTIYQTWTSYFAFALKYWPTLTCSHCSNSAHEGIASKKSESQDQCSGCYKIFNTADPPIGESNTQNFEELNHILELCFDHRTKLVDDHTDYLIRKVLRKGICGVQIFLDVKKYGL